MPHDCTVPRQKLIGRQIELAFRDIGIQVLEDLVKAKNTKPLTIQHYFRFVPISDGYKMFRFEGVVTPFLNQTEKITEYQITGKVIIWE